MEVGRDISRKRRPRLAQRLCRKGHVWPARERDRDRWWLGHLLRVTTVEAVVCVHVYGSPQIILLYTRITPPSMMGEHHRIIRLR